MDEIFKLWIASSPATLVIFLLGSQVIKVAKDNLEEGRKQRTAIIFRLKEIENKLGLVFNEDDIKDLP